MAEFAALLALWVATWLVHSTLLYGLAWLVERLRLLRAPAAREHLWRAAMVGALLTATLQSTGLVERVPLGIAGLFTKAASAGAGPARPAALPPQPAARAEVRVSEASEPALLGVAGELAAPASGVSGVVTASLATTAWADLRATVADAGPAVLFVVWLAGACFGALRLLALGWLARRQLAGRMPATGSLAADFAALCGDQRVARPPLCVAPALAGPISLPNGEIALPPWAVAALGARQRRAMLAHELAHQVRRDPQWLACALVLQSLLWLQPLAALARRRLAALAELQADAWAARAVGDPRALAECLAECAERLTTDRVALFGAAMTNDSLLVERVHRLLEGVSMRTQTATWPLRGGVLATLAAAAFLFPGCNEHSFHIGGAGSSTNITVSGDGETSVKIRRSGYSLDMVCDGVVTYAPDESDVATLAAGCRFKLSEQLDGLRHDYTLTSDRSGALSRSYSRDGEVAPLDGAGREWLAQALPRLFRESGFEIEARVARLLASGGPARVLTEVELAQSDHVKASYLGLLLGSTELDSEQLGLALGALSGIDSDFELRSALCRALDTQSLDAQRFTLLLQSASRIGSDFDKAELLVDAARRLPEAAETRAAWMALAGEIRSDFDLARVVDAALDRDRADAPFTAQLIALAAGQIDSDYNLRTLLEEVAPRADDPAVAAAYLAALAGLESDFDRRAALEALLDEATLGTASLSTALDLAAGFGSDFEKCQVLKTLATLVAADAGLNRRYREIAGTMSEFERGAALVAIDDASRS